MNGPLRFLWTICLLISLLGQQGAQAFWCSNGVFLSSDHVCDFTDHCGDNSDEQQCKYHVPSSNSSSLSVLRQRLTGALGIQLDSCTVDGFISEALGVKIYCLINMIHV